MPKLFMLLIGCTPPDRHIEQHDVFFGIAAEISELFPELNAFWPEAPGRIHIDAWRELRFVNGFEVKIHSDKTFSNSHLLYFINLGGYRKNVFEEFYYKMIVAATGKGEAIALAKQSAFYKHTGFKGANSHIDDRYGIDVDDFHAIPDILPTQQKSKFRIELKPAPDHYPEDELHTGYFKLTEVKKWANLTSS